MVTTTAKQRGWKMKLPFLRSSHVPESTSRRLTPPPEFTCPVSGLLMADPVIVPSGQSFERCCVQACRELGYVPRMKEGERPDMSSLIPNLGLRSAIVGWCDGAGVARPVAPSLDEAKEVVRRLIESSGVAKQASLRRDGGSGGKKVSLGGSESGSGSSEKELLKGMTEHPQVKSFYAATEVNRRPEPLYLNSSDGSPVKGSVPGPRTPLPLTTKPACFSTVSSSSSSSSYSVTDADVLQPTSTSAAGAEEDEIYRKLKSPQETDQEEALVLLRKMTKTSPEMRAALCTPRLLAAMRPLLVSRYAVIQVNAVAALVNLSLEKRNKVQIVRAGAVPALVDALKGGSPEAQEHAAGAVFSLALDDENKTAIGVLGALPPLLHLLVRSDSARAREDAALALYHLSLAPANRSKLVKLGATSTLLALACGAGGTPGLSARALIILCNVAAGAEGRSALLDAHAVERMLRALRESNPGAPAPEREGCVAVLYALSQSRMRFRGSAKAAGAVEVLREVAATGSERAREKAVRMLRMLREKRSEEALAGLGEDEDDEWRGEDTPESESVVAIGRRLARGKLAGANSTEF